VILHLIVRADILESSLYIIRRQGLAKCICVALTVDCVQAVNRRYNDIG